MVNYVLHITTEQAQLLVCEIIGSSYELLHMFDNKDKLLSELSGFRIEKRKREYLGVRLALKKLLGEEPAVYYDKEGKPYLCNHSHQISISHSGRWVAVIAHPTYVVGIDIEQINNVVRKIYPRFLSQQEQSDYGKNTAKLNVVWSAKETLYKIIGKAVNNFATTLRVLPFALDKEGELLSEHIETKKIYTLHYLQNDAYTLVYCVVNV